MLAALEEGNPSATAYFKFQAFTTAVVQDQRIRVNMKAALAGNLKRGEGERDFKKVVDAEFDRAGLTRLAPHQINNIYETNVSLAFGAGQMQKMLDLAGDFPYWKFSATLDSKTRPDHAALHGKIFKVGDFTFFPPLSFRCRCTAIPLTARQAGKYLQSDMPTGTERDKLYDLLSSKEFAGNKQQKFMEWAAAEYKSADPAARKLIDKAFDTMRSEIRNLKDDGQSFIPKELIENSNYLKGTKIKLKNDFFKLINQDNPVRLIVEKKGKCSYYSPSEKTVHIVNSDRSAKSNWHRESVIYHEYGHAIDWQRNMRNQGEVKQLMKFWQKELNKKQTCTAWTYELDRTTWKLVYKRQTAELPKIAAVSTKLDLIREKVVKMDNGTFQRLGITKNDVLEQIAATQDTIKAINIKYGWGHSTAYFRNPGLREAEFIAHCFENKFAGNRIFQKYLPELYQAMIDFIGDLQ